MGLSPIRTNKFSPSLVHSLEKKMDKRINRLTRVFQPTIKEMKLVFENDYLNKLGYWMLQFQDRFEHEFEKLSYYELRSFKYH